MTALRMTKNVNNTCLDISVFFSGVDEIFMCKQYNNYMQ